MPDETIEQVQERMAWLEKHLSELDEVVQTMAEELRALRAEVAALRERPGDPDGNPGGWEVPPHY